MLIQEPRKGFPMSTSEGKYFWPRDPRVEEVSIDVIAHHLGMQVRFAGACKEFVSIAEHSVLVSYVAEEDGKVHYALEKLLHDAPEAYIQDWIRPIKHDPEFKPIYQKLEAPIERLVAQKFGLHHPFPPEVKRADEMICCLEIRDNIANPHVMDDATLHVPTPIQPHLYLRYWTPKRAKEMFLRRFYEIIHSPEYALAHS